jgi:hypothetical protein
MVSDERSWRDVALFLPFGRHNARQTTANARVKPSRSQTWLQSVVFHDSADVFQVPP